VTADWAILIQEGIDMKSFDLESVWQRTGIHEMSELLDPIRAARLLERWVNFYGMDDKDAGPTEDYPDVKRYLLAMELAIEVLRGNKSKTAADIRKAATLLEEWPNVHSMDDPSHWESEDFPFVLNALKAILFAASFLKEPQQSQ